MEKLKPRAMIRHNYKVLEPGSKPKRSISRAHTLHHHTAPEENEAERGLGSCLKSHSKEALEPGFKLRSGCSQGPTLQPLEAKKAVNEADRGGEQEGEGAISVVPPSLSQHIKDLHPGWQLNNLSSSAPAHHYWVPDLFLSQVTATVLNRNKPCCSLLIAFTSTPICLHS